MENPRSIAADIVEAFENVLIENNICVPSPEDEERNPEDMLGLYGSVYFGLLDYTESRILDALNFVYPFCTLDSSLAVDDQIRGDGKLAEISAILSEHNVPVAEIITGEIPYSTLKSCAEKLVESGAVAAAGLSKYTPLSGNMSEFKLSITMREEENESGR